MFHKLMSTGRRRPARRASRSGGMDAGARREMELRSLQQNRTAPAAIPERFAPGNADDIVPPPWTESRPRDSKAVGTTASGPGARTALNQVPPACIANLLRSESVDPASLLLFTDTDIDRVGHYQRQWLAVMSDRLFVCGEGSGDSADHRASIITQLKFSDVGEFRCESVIGSGLLQARVDGLFVDLLRYSNHLSDRFNKVARKLDRALHGEAITVHADDELDPRRCKSCGLMLDFAGETCPRCVNKGAVLARMAKLMVPYRGSAIIMMVLMLVGIGFDMIGPKLTQQLVDNVLPTSSAAAHELVAKPTELHHHIAVLLGIVLMLAGAQVARTIVNIFNGRLSCKVGTGITYDMRGRLVQHLQQLSVSYYDRQQVGSLVARVAYDTEALQGFISQLTGGFLLQLVMVVVAGAMMFSVDVKLAIFTLVPAPLIVAGAVVFWRFIYPRYYRCWDAASKQAGMLSGMLSGVRVVKAFGQEDREEQRFNKASDYMTSSRRNVDMTMCTFNPIMGLVFQLGGWIVWYVGGRDVLGARLSLGALMAFFGYLGMFYSPLGALTQFTNWLTSFVTQAHRIFEILDTPVQIAEAQSPVRRQIMGEIEFEKVSFGYNRHHQVLRNIDLHVQPGEMIGVVGRSGSGKSTIVNLICRFYDVNEGSVRIDGRDVREFAKDNLRGQIGVVLQEPFLFRGSIGENIAYGRPDASAEEVIRAAKAGNCHDFILRNPHGYDTWVGERGAGLSGGERQRVSIARVLLTDPKILILDEATSSVDAESEAAIQAAMAEVVKNRTTIAIAHRLSTLRNANRILVVDNGQIVESGSHEQLMTQAGLYSRLVHMQGQTAPPPTMDHLMAEENEARRHGRNGSGFRVQGSGEEDGENRAQRDTGVSPVLGALEVEETESTEAPASQHGRDARVTLDGTRAGADSEGASALLPPINGFQPRWLTPANARIHLGNHGALHVTVIGERIYGAVFAVRCMPVRHPRQYVSLRYLDHEKREVEIGLLRDLNDWPADAQSLIEESLQKRYLVHTIRQFHSIEQVQGYLNVSAETDLGPRKFIMRWQADKAQDYGTAGKMLVDTEENRYLVPDVASLPERDRGLFMRYIYW